MPSSQQSASTNATWLLTDGHAGNLRQAEALARALGVEGAYAPTLQPRAPWRWLAPRCLPGAGHGMGRPSQWLQSVLAPIDFFNRHKAK